MNTIRGVIWDIDGTLLNSNDAHARAYAEALALEGLHFIPDQIRRKIGEGGDKLLPELTGIEQGSQLGRRISENKKRIFEEKYFPSLKPFSKAKELLETMRERGLKFAVGTSAGREECERFLKRVGVDHLMDEIISSDDVEESKPDPDIVSESCRRLNLSPKRVLMVGDTPYDIMAASRAGLKTVAFRSGGWADEDLQGALAIYDGAADLLGHLDPSPFFTTLRNAVSNE